MVLGGARAYAATIPGAAEQVLALVNQARAQAGLASLTMDPQLNQSAQSYSDYMASANFYAHDGPDGSTPLSRMNAAGFPGTGRRPFGLCDLYIRLNRKTERMRHYEW